MRSVFVLIERRGEAWRAGHLAAEFGVAWPLTHLQDDTAPRRDRRTYRATRTPLLDRSPHRARDPWPAAVAARRGV